MHENYPYSSQDLSSLGVYGSNEYYDQLGSWYNPRTWFKKKKSKPLFWDTGIDIAESVVKSDWAKKTGKAVFDKVADSNMEVITTTNTTVNGKKSPTRTTKRNTTPRKEWSSFTSFFGNSPVNSLSSLGVYDPNTLAMSGLFDTLKSAAKGVASTVGGAAKSVVNTVTGSAKKKAKSSVKKVKDDAAKKVSSTIKSKTGVDISSKDLTSAVTDISKGKISKGVTNLGTKAASQVVNKYGAQAATQLSQLTNQYTAALNVPQTANIGSQASALTAQSSVPMLDKQPATTEQSSATASKEEEKGLSTGAMVGIGVGVLGILGVGGYFLWSAKENKKQSKIDQQQRAVQYQNLQAINNPKSKKSKAKKSKAKSKARK